MNRVAVINIVGLTGSLLEHAPNLRQRAAQGQLLRLTPVLPAVTCSVQASMLTGLPPRDHGIVANGWYDRELAEVQFWKQSNHLVQGEKVWETARKRDAGVTCANICWWYNMYSSVDYSVTPRPIYKADGRKIPDCYTEPPALRDELQSKLGTFPLFQFWGPGAGIASSRWIVNAALHIERRYQPTLSLIYLPHLDYDLQRHGPEDRELHRTVGAIDSEAGRLLDALDKQGVRPIVVSEYGIEQVDDAVAINKVLRQAGTIRVRDEQGLELLDAGASDAFAVADHQIAHVYVKNAEDIERIAELCKATPGVAEVLDRAAQHEAGIDHERSGELVLIAEAQRWFIYDYWLDDAKAPDYARTVDIHRKPGYDPRELFIDPAIKLPAAAIGWRVLKKKLGMRMLMDVIPLDTKLVRGSHGRVTRSAPLQPVMILPEKVDDPRELPCTAVRDVILSAMFEERISIATDKHG